MRLYRFFRSGRGAGHRFHLVLAACLLAAAVVATAYSDTDMGAAARVVISPPPQAQLAVETFAPVLMPEVIVRAVDVADPAAGADAAAVDEQSDVQEIAAASLLPPEPAAAPARHDVVCGQVTNNTGHVVRLTGPVLSGLGEDTATGFVTLAASRLERGEMANLLCHVAGLAAGQYAWTGRIFASWPGGEAHVPFAIELTVPEPQIIEIAATDESLDAAAVAADDIAAHDETTPEQDAAQEDEAAERDAAVDGDPNSESDMTNIIDSQDEPIDDSADATS